MAETRRVGFREAWGGCLARIRRATVLSGAVCASIALALVGCGSGSGSAFDIDGRPLSSAPSPFAGCWSGTGIARETEQGTLDAMISPEGRLTFTLVNRSTGAAGMGSGSVTRTGALIASYRSPSGSVLTQKGSVTLAANGHLLGQFETFEGRARLGSGGFDLVRCGSSATHG